MNAYPQAELVALHSGRMADEEEIAKLPAKQRDPFEACAAKMAVEQLSREAQELIQIICHSPLEAYRYFTSPTRGYISTKRLKTYLREMEDWPWSKIEKAFEQVERYVQALED